MAWPVFDALGVAGLARSSPDVAWQLLSMTAEVFAADFTIGTFVKALVDRERPHGLECSTEDRASRPARCGRHGRTRSFYSGHASAGFASAGLVCMVHAHLSLYGDPAGDALACGGALLSASIIGALRMISDRHFATDVLVGALAGLAAGLLLPYALHFGWDGRGDDVAGAGGALSGGTLGYGFAF